MLYDRVFAALAASGLTDKYKKAFEENEMTDLVVQGCLDNEDDRAFLNDVIRVVGHRIHFVKEFRKLPPQEEEEEEEQHQQEEISVVSRPNENLTNNLNITEEKYQNSAGPSSTSTSCSSFLNNTTSDVAISLPKSHDNAMKSYTDSMNNLLGPSKVFYSAFFLQLKHNEFKSQALENFTTNFKILYNSPSSSSFHEVQVMLEQAKLFDSPKLLNVSQDKNNQHKEEVLKSKLNDLNVDIDIMFEMFKEKNELRESNYISGAKNIVGEAEKIYSCKMDEYMENCNDEDELIEKQKEVNQLALDHLNNNIKNPCAKPEFILQLNQELKETISKWFEQHLELFQLRLEEDEIVVREALLSAKNYYNEEMDKHFTSKKFMEPAALIELDTKISAAAMKKCKDLPLTPGQKKQLGEATGLQVE